MEALYTTIKRINSQLHQLYLLQHFLTDITLSIEEDKQPPPPCGRPSSALISELLLLGESGDIEQLCSSSPCSHNPDTSAAASGPNESIPAVYVSDTESEQCNQHGNSDVKCLKFQVNDSKDKKMKDNDICGQTSKDGKHISGQACDDMIPSVNHGKVNAIAPSMATKANDKGCQIGARLCYLEKEHGCEYIAQSMSQMKDNGTSTCNHIARTESTDSAFGSIWNDIGALPSPNSITKAVTQTMDQNRQFVPARKSAQMPLVGELECAFGNSLNDHVIGDHPSVDNDSQDYHSRTPLPHATSEKGPVQDMYHKQRMHDQSKKVKEMNDMDIDSIIEDLTTHLCGHGATAVEHKFPECEDGIASKNTAKERSLVCLKGNNREQSHSTDLDDTDNTFDPKKEPVINQLDDFRIGCARHDCTAHVSDDTGTTTSKGNEKEPCKSVRTQTDISTNVHKDIGSEEGDIKKDTESEQNTPTEDAFFKSELFKWIASLSNLFPLEPNDYRTEMSQKDMSVTLEDIETKDLKTQSATTCRECSICRSVMNPASAQPDPSSCTSPSYSSGDSMLNGWTSGESSSMCAHCCAPSGSSSLGSPRCDAGRSPGQARRKRHLRRRHCCKHCRHRKASVSTQIDEQTLEEHCAAPICEECTSVLVSLKWTALKLWMPYAMQRGRVQYTESALCAGIRQCLSGAVGSDWRCSVCGAPGERLVQQVTAMVQGLERKQQDLATMATPGPPNANTSSKKQRSRMPEPRRRDSPYPSQTAINAAADPARIRQAKKAYSQMFAAVTSPKRPRELALIPSTAPTSSRVPQRYLSSSSSASSRSPQTVQAACRSPQTVQGTGRSPQTVQGVSRSPQTVQGAGRTLQTSSSMTSSSRSPQIAATAGRSPQMSTSMGRSPQMASSSLRRSQPDRGQTPGSPAMPSSPQASPAASFFVRAAQKLNMSGRKKKKREMPAFPTNFMDMLRHNPPPAPPALLRRTAANANSKVKVMLRVCPTDGTASSSFLKTDERRKQVTVYDPSAGMTSLRRPMPPKMFAFDAICDQDDSLSELCSQSLLDIIQSVVNGSDGCLFCYGHARLGKTYTMIGIDDSPQNLGVIPCAIAWLFRLINEQKQQTQARFSVRVSAVEVTGKQEHLKDLLADDAAAVQTQEPAPGVYLRDDPICGMQLENQSELRAPSAERAAYYLDAAVAARTIPEVEEDARNSHMLFTLHIYQYRVDSSDPCQPTVGVAGGRSRLHLLDLGSCSKSSKDSGASLSLGALGTVILALLNGQRHVPHRHSKLTQLIRDSLGNSSCRTCMIAHVSPAMAAYNETLQVIQLASKIHRSRPRNIPRHSKFSSTSSDDSSCDEARLRRFRRGIRMGTLREGALSDPSSSELSCDTVIYVGPHGQALSDRELTDNEGPPTRHPPKMGMHRSRPAGEDAAIVPRTATTGSQTPPRHKHTIQPQHTGQQWGNRHTPPPSQSRPLPPRPQPSTQMFTPSSPQSRQIPQPSPSQGRHSTQASPQSRHHTPQASPRHQASSSSRASPQLRQQQQHQQQQQQQQHTPLSSPRPVVRPASGRSHTRQIPTLSSRLQQQQQQQQQQPGSESPSTPSRCSHKKETLGAGSTSRPRKLHVSKAAAAAAAAAVANQGSEQWIDGPAAETWIDGPCGGREADQEEPAVPVKAFVRDWVEKHSGSSVMDTTTVAEVEPEPPRPSTERTLAWVKAVTMEQSPEDLSSPPPAYETCMQAPALPPPPSDPMPAQPQEQKQEASRESIYEMHMDETLETISGDKSFRNTFTSEEEVELLPEEEEEMEVDEEEEIAETMALLEETEKQEIRRPTCLRRPDGASNPNLCALVEEEPTETSRLTLNVDSDSGNDSSNIVPSKAIVRRTAPVAIKSGAVSSSGYESMVRDSELTNSCSSSSASSDGGSPTQTKGDRSIEPLTIQEYSVDDVERMARRRREEEMRAACKRRHRVQELLKRQERLKGDLAHAKRLLMVSPASWSYDLYVAEQMEPDNPHYLEALDKETQILEKRVEAAKSRIMIVTCFDSFNV